MKKDWVTQTRNKRDSIRHTKEAVDAMRKLPCLTDPAEIDNEDAIDELIEITVRAMVNAGIDPAQEPETFIQSRQYITGTIGGDLNERRMDLAAIMVAGVDDLHTVLFSALSSLVSAKRTRDAGDASFALKLVAAAVPFLMRSVSLSYSAERKNGGDLKPKAKAAAIDESRKLWLERENGRHSKLRTEDQFAMEVARRWPIIASISAIKKRSTEWRKELKQQRQAKRTC